MKRKFALLVITALLLIPWPVAYAYDNVNASHTPVTIQPADQSHAPRIKAFHNAIGSVNPGDLFEIDTLGAVNDISFQLLMTNTGELVKSFRYMTLKIGIYVRTSEAAGWELLKTTSGEKYPDMYITMQNGITVFTLPGGAVYRITVEGGCFYCYGGPCGSSAPAPAFYIAIV